MIFTGRSADGSDMFPANGVYLSPDGEEWSNMPYTKEDRMHEEVYDYLASNLRSMRMEYNLIKEKKSKLSRRLRDYIVSVIEEL